MKIAFVSCSKMKREIRCHACEMFTSALFRKAFSYCKDHYDQVYILSAHYGLLHEKQMIAPFDRAMRQLSASQRRDWAVRVHIQLLDQLRKQSIAWEEIELVAFYAGEDYRTFLIELFPETIPVVVPLAGLPIGKQLRFFKEQGY
jgi:hypothetical protein